MHVIAWGLLAALFAAGKAAPPAQPQPAAAARPAPAPPALGELTPDATVDQILDALDQRGQNLKSFDAKVTLTESDVNTALETTRSGVARYQKKPDASERMRVVFDKKTESKRVFDEKIEYMLDGQWLIDRDYNKRIEVRRQVLKPGEKTNLLKLGEGPFPLPIGQKKEDVKKLFTVTKAKPAKGDPAGTVHLVLKPLKGTQFARKFSVIDVWVDAKTHMPRKIETLDVKETTTRGTDLSDFRPNAPLNDADFKLDPVPPDKWRTHEEQFRE
jgi:outer membrane lipoprotein-sorting protein